MWGGGVQHCVEVAGGRTDRSADDFGCAQELCVWEGGQHSVDLDVE